MKATSTCPAPSRNRGTQCSFLRSTRSCQSWSPWESSCHCRDTVPIGVYHRRICRDDFDCHFGLTDCDILPVFVSFEVRQCEPVRHFQSGSVLRCKGYAAQDNNRDSQQNRDIHRRRKRGSLHDSPLCWCLQVNSMAAGTGPSGLQVAYRAPVTASAHLRSRS